MHNILNKNFILRGWEDQPYGIVNLDNGEKHYLGFDEYEVILQNENGFTPLQQYKRYPCKSYQTVEWALTKHCNYRCRHCYISAPGITGKDLSLQDCFRFIQQIADVGIFQIELTGGECLLRKDFFQIIDKLIEHHIRVKAILSNGALISKEILHEFSKRNLRPAFQISFDGTNGCHNWLRSVHDAEEKTLQGIRLLKENGYPVFVVMTMHKGNCESLRDTALLLGSMNVDNLYVGYVAQMGEWLKGNEIHSMSSQEYYNMYLDYLPFYKKDGKPINIQLSGMFRCSKNSDAYTIPMKKKMAGSLMEKCVCRMASEKLYVSPDGNVMPCPLFTGTMLGERMPNVFQSPLSEILSKSLYLQYARCTYQELTDKGSKCIQCPYLCSCGGVCQGNELKDSHFSKEKEMACTFFKGGYESKMKRVWASV